MSMVIPDSIQPYLGYKALRIGTDGQLRSPQQTSFIWPVGKKAEGVCNRNDSYEWKLVPKCGVSTQPRAPQIFPALEQRVVTYSYEFDSGDAVYWPWPYPASGPEGYEYIWTPVGHEAGAEGCTCGIYVVESLEQCRSYVQSDCVLCEVALWGQVTTAYKGARGQFAYPQKMLIPDHLMDVGPLVADLYGIPYEERTLIRKAWQGRPQVSWPAEHEKVVKQAARRKAEQERRDAGSASVCFLLMSAILWPATTLSFIAAGFWATPVAFLAVLISVLTLFAFFDWKKPLPEA